MCVMVFKLAHTVTDAHPSLTPSGMGTFASVTLGTPKSVDSVWLQEGLLEPIAKTHAQWEVTSIATIRSAWLVLMDV